ncbi:pyrroline-5-carboxylate reductase [Schaalia sp. 19OD2882]|uniref:pyrroline-5-carboxylate reductase n=1 Tax=Schaalia sp. 19OD2882 TaxID=2794089 RepID=UPI001C1EE43B|nr:pyrroline-5-carboxylate reductase [Schaalia sp. 19OD2882]QWW19050.1 pyrroline-5-carboxylate reductase [Schaalia sp. 19OD2882]
MRIGFIGTGAMVSAIVRGAVAAGISATDFVLTNRTGARAAALAEEVGASWAPSNTSLAQQVDIVVLGVKPQVQSAVIREIAEVVRERESTVVSIAAGRTIGAIVTDFGVGVPVVRVMPNVNALIGRSMTGICSAEVDPEVLAVVTRLMESVGTTVTLDEKDFPAFSALAGCSPAWVFQIIDSLARTGVKYGLPKATAVRIAAQAVAGSADLVLAEGAKGVVPAQLIDRVTSPGGTTIAGLLAGEEAGLSTALLHAVDAAVARDAQLG